MPLLAARPLASLSSGLLARKGQARPAMRAQGLVSFTTAAPLDDLGWNDMGEGQAEPGAPAPEPVAAEVPPVLVARAALCEEIEGPQPEPEPEPELQPDPRPTPEPRVRTGAARAAFTLRLDAERHLRLRLASATANRSAQRLMIEALDAMLAAMPEVEALAARAGRGRDGGDDA